MDLDMKHDLKILLDKVAAHFETAAGKKSTD